MSRPIKVLYISNQNGFSGGAERSIRDLIYHLDRTKVEPYFASIFHGDLAHSIIRTGAPFVQLSKLNKANPLSFLISNLNLIYFIRKYQIQIIHNNQSGDTFYSFFPGKLTRTPIITHHRESRYFRSDNFFARHVSANIAISSWQNQKFLNNCAILIHNGIPRNQIPEPDCRSVRIKERTTVGLIGRIAPMKGQDVFIRAANIVLQKKRGIHFVMVGDDKNGFYPDYLHQLMQMIQDFHLEMDLEFTGYVDSAAQILPQIDISVIPSVREPFGKVIIESMAYCKPVIGTNVGGALDIITKDTGILIPVNNEQALADAICFLIDRPEVCVQMGLAGRERVIEHFTLENTLSKIYDLYEQLVK
jgi:glycosyltransferase involved in cell wall biosynthesis